MLKILAVNRWTFPYLLLSVGMLEVENEACTAIPGTISSRQPLSFSLSFTTGKPTSSFTINPLLQWCLSLLYDLYSPNPASTPGGGANLV